MSRLRDLARALSGHRVAVIGDVMVDHFLVGRIDRISPEAPVPVVRVERDEYRLGGAANVAHNIRALGSEAALVGLVGDDDAAAGFRQQLTAVGVTDAHLVVEPGRRTTRKVRVVSPRHQQVVRLDYEDDHEPQPEAMRSLAADAAAATRRADVVVVSDYRKGVCSPEVLSAVTAAAAERRTPILIDPKVPNAARYRGATILTPNHHEAEVMTGLAIRTSDDAREACRKLHDQCGASIVITWGERGMWLHDAAGAHAPSELHLPASAREVADVTGAGDTVIALLALATAAGARLADAARLATTAAGLAVARFGPSVVALDELVAALPDTDA